MPTPHTATGPGRPMPARPSPDPARFHLFAVIDGADPEYVRVEVCTRCASLVAADRLGDHHRALHAERGGAA